MHSQYFVIIKSLFSMSFNIFRLFFDAKKVSNGFFL